MNHTAILVFKELLYILLSFNYSYSTKCRTPQLNLHTTKISSIHTQNSLFGKKIICITSNVLPNLCCNFQIPGSFSFPCWSIFSLALILTSLQFETTCFVMICVGKTETIHSGFSTAYFGKCSLFSHLFILQFSVPAVWSFNTASLLGPVLTSQTALLCC